ncbi:DUF2125 domain-containing protein [Palleronia sp. KMU-117]|uniref:DUF2125 domain-containing protein n=1 Tax=Palleronia sp. KMU-117 TaxID=3434108 RepID=UPI003D744157
MSKSFLFPTVFAVLAASPALADLTAAQVWSGWQAFASQNGYQLSATSESQSGDTLTVSGVTMAMSEADATVSGTLGDFTFIERGDGTVSVDLPADWPMTFSGTDSDGVDFSATLTLSHTGLDLVVSGQPGQTLHTYTAPEISLTSTGFETGGEAVPVDLDVTLTNLAGEYEIVDGTPMSIRSDMSAGGAAAAFSAVDTEGSGDRVSLLASMTDMVSTSVGTMSSFTAMAGLGEMIAEGLTSEGTLSYRNASYQIAGSGEGQDFELSAGAGSGQLDVSVGENGLSYGGTNSDVTVNVASSQMPLPDASLAMANSSWKFDMPIAVSAEPQDFALLLRIDGLTVSDTLWSMFDPMSTLPRDPAALVLDLAGKGKWLVDITDPALAETPMEGPPGELQALTIRELRLDVAGAELTGTGDLTFDNSAMPPVPAGAIDLQLVGGNGLMDKLVAMGLLPQEQAMGMRMMLGLFARPGAGEDTLVSTIELTPDGGIVANGQPLR